MRLVVVKITTDQAGLYGYGCATFTQRADLVVPAVEKYLKPFLIGKPADRIEDTWQACYNSSYWRNGPVLNNAISGVDQALWDIKGRQAGMPVYQLLGGKVREACATYTSVSGNEIPQVIDAARRAMEQGFRHVRVAGRGARHGGLRRRRRRRERAQSAGSARPPGLRARSLHPARASRCCDECRKELGDEVELLHDVHERVSPREAVQFAKDVEDVKLFYLEDVAVARGHRLLPPDPPAVRHLASPWASCSTARTNGRR